MKRTLLAALLLLLAAPGLRAADIGDSNGAVTGTAKVSGLEVPLSQLLVTVKAGYTHILWDAFPQRTAIKVAGRKFQLRAAVLDLIKGPGLGASPAAKLFKVDIAEFPERDDYGAPRWDKLTFLGRFEAVKKGKRWVLSPRKED